MNTNKSPLPDGIIRREITDLTLRSVNEEERSFEVICSTDTMDAHGDVVEQSFDLKRYTKNPVVLYGHNQRSARPEDSLPIGHASNVRVEGGKLIAKLTLIKGSDEQEPLVAKIWRRVQQGSLRAVSIGFRPGKVTEEKNAQGKHYYKLSDNELFEISIVPIPSNPDAVAKSVAYERAILSHRAETEATGFTPPSTAAFDEGPLVLELLEPKERRAEPTPHGIVYGRWGTSSEHKSSFDESGAMREIEGESVDIRGLEGESAAVALLNAEVAK